MINGIGCMEGVVVCSEGEEFSFCFSVIDWKWDKLVDIIIWCFNKDCFGLEEDWIVLCK